MKSNFSVNELSPWVSMEFGIGLLPDEGLDLALEVKFGNHYIDLAPGRVWYGISHCELKLEPVNAEIPMHEWWPNTPFVIESVVKYSDVKSTGSTQVVAQERSAAGGLSSKGASGTLGSSLNTSKGEETTQTCSAEFQRIEYQLKTKGNRSCGYWIFQVNIGREYLEGDIPSKKICKIVPLENQWTVQGELGVPKLGIEISGVEGFIVELGYKVKKQVFRAYLRHQIFKNIQSKLKPFELTLFSGQNYDRARD
ncbi:TPA: hypothetical protein ACVU5U_000611 [Vibrio parahaemolyticus]|uniref:hypothetical protein n=1 Tax=Vibrio harveyi group TaxID=717610 RepID=UPI002253E879|nr:hypothetical protein [Vibrio parahaemolyticus]EIQ7472409.1 hypothetical protein [Vibrio parahaemolyticus]MCX4117685.1 hypothetical protein [Vibrio parahaemolyticus]HCM0709861.1 hypothetical protein [Vibrio parahaemolyticus]